MKCCGEFIVVQLVKFFVVRIRDHDSTLVLIFLFILEFNQHYSLVGSDVLVNSEA
jgi:hypothetical protein